MLSKKLLSTFFNLVLLFSIAICCANASQTTYSVEQLKSDFTELYTEIARSHFDLYAHLPKPDYDAAFQQYLHGIRAPMTEAQARIYFQRFVALGRVAHAKIDLPIQDFLTYRGNGGTMLPLFVHVREQGVFIDEVYAKEPRLQAGMQVTQLDNRDMALWIDDMSALISADNQRLANTLIESQMPFLIWLLVGEKSQFSVTVESGEVSQTLKIEALTREQQSALVQSASSENDEPRTAKMLDNGIAYLRPGPFYNIDDQTKDTWDSSHFTRFIDAAFDEFLTANAKALLIDLRSNPGGTNSFSDHMLGWFATRPFRFASSFEIKLSQAAIDANKIRLANSSGDDRTSRLLAERYQQQKLGDVFSYEFPLTHPREGKRFTQPVFVLVDRYSYSNAVSVAAIVQDYGFATVLGEETADLATTYGAMEHFTLTHTAFEVGFPKALIVRPNGDKKPSGVMPDWPIDAGSSVPQGDSMLEMALSRIAGELKGK
ncbi:S41 family peptidase [Alteromonas facilis]|uniref:S41 family peptidase n=1 Tax=Alteromonas facilis TaxID=2048004 RepID=UPI000C290399|nr:S41 family peptidase [Alteromonas facilis]